MKLSQQGINLLKEYEGLRLEAYQDQGGKWTIGWGNTYYEDNSEVKQGDVITKEEADSLYKIIVERFDSYVNNNCANMDIAVTQNQFDALVSFTYNLGESNLKDILSKYKEGRLTREYWCLFSNVRIGGVLTKSQGLVNRRNKEYDLFEIGTKPSVEPKIEKIEVVNKQVDKYIVEDEIEKFFSISKKSGSFAFNVSTTKLTKAVLAIAFIIMAYRGLVPVEAILGALFGYGMNKK